VSSLVDQLKRVAPVTLRVFLLDGGERTVAVPKNRNRWARTMQVIESLDWEKIECLDKDNRLLSAIENEEEESEFADDGGDDDRLHKLGKLMLEVMRSTQAETRKMFEAQLTGQAKLVEAMVSGMQQVSDSYALALKVQAAQLTTGGPEGGQDEVLKMMMLAGQLMQKPGRPATPPPPPIERKP
jgi:hypothetical protein